MLHTLPAKLEFPSVTVLLVPFTRFTLPLGLFVLIDWQKKIGKDLV